MKTLQEKYNAILEGNFSKKQFVRDARLAHSNLITQFNSFADTVAILKNKGMVVEAKKAEVTAYKKPEVDPIDMIAPDLLDHGIEAELHAAGITGTPSEEEYAKAKEKADRKASKTPIDWSKIGAGAINVVKNATDTITTLAPVMQKPEFQKNLEATCGKSGVILGIGKPRPSYLTCAKNFMEKQGVSNTQFDEWKNTLNTDDANTSNSPSTTGMSLGAKIGITAGILAVVGVAVFFIVKGGKKGK